MFIRWQKSSRVSKLRKCARSSAVLIESVRIDGKPRQRHVAVVGDYWGDAPTDLAGRSRFWRNVRKRLDALDNQVSKDDRVKIEAALAARVPPTTLRQDAEYEAEDKARNDRETAALAEACSLLPRRPKRVKETRRQLEHRAYVLERRLHKLWDRIASGDHAP